MHGYFITTSRVPNRKNSSTHFYSKESSFLSTKCAQNVMYFFWVIGHIDHNRDRSRFSQF